MSGVVRVFVEYARFDHDGRDAEVRLALSHNSSLNFVDELIIVAGKSSKEHLTAAQGIDWRKAHHFLLDERCTFDKMFAIANEHSSSNDISVVVNSDIALGRGFPDIGNHIQNSNDFLCISRHEPGGALCSIPRLSQDVWAWRGECRVKHCDFFFGILGCDNVVARRAIEAGYNVKNPCSKLVATHFHQTGFRTYDGKTRIRPQSLYKAVPPS